MDKRTPHQCLARVGRFPKVSRCAACIIARLIVAKYAAVFIAAYPAVFIATSARLISYPIS